MDQMKVVVVDVSSFMLFEATGDSEADSELNGAAADVDIAVADADDDIDAQSCSFDLLDSGRIFELGDCELHHDMDDTHDEEGHHVDDEEEEEEEGEVIDQDWSGGDGDELEVCSTAKSGPHKKPRVCVDSTMELMSEMEKSRLFWETCLAS